MNYYNPYDYGMPNAFAQQERVGLFSKLFKGNINFTSILNNTGKVLQIANQTIPLVKQVTPVVRNAKTMFKVLNEFKKNDDFRKSQKKKNNKENQQFNYSEYNTSGPTFFA